MKDYRRKMQFWLRVSGWLCLLPAASYLLLYHMYQGQGAGNFAGLLLLEIVIVVIFGAYLLTTYKLPRWEKPRNLVFLMVFAFLFVSLLIFITLCIALANCLHLQRK